VKCFTPYEGKKSGRNDEIVKLIMVKKRIPAKYQEDKRYFAGSGKVFS
jgi:hypothetical protein